jgi:hypothetical protein
VKRRYVQITGFGKVFYKLFSIKNACKNVANPRASSVHLDAWFRRKTIL